MRNWLYIETYSFLFIKGERVILYNTLNNTVTKIDHSSSVSALLSKLAEEKCIELSDEQLKDENIRRLIDKLRQSFNGDLIEHAGGEIKPAIFQPIINNQKGFERMQHLKMKNINTYTLDYLDEIFIYLNGFNADTSSLEIYRQIPSYIETDDSLPANELVSFLSQIPDKHIDQINLLGGNLFQYKFLAEILKIANKKASGLNLYLLYTAYHDEMLGKYMHSISVITLIVPLFSLDKKQFESIFKAVSKRNIRTKWSFIITSDKEYAQVETILATYKIESYKIEPVYTGNNLSFFENEVYIDEEDIMAETLDKRSIFTNQSINKQDFGRLTLLPNGEIYANVNYPPLGTIQNNSISEIVYNEFSSGHSWLNTRKSEPCCNCVYQWLCPSPSHYEQAIGKSNLCVIEP